MSRRFFGMLIKPKALSWLVALSGALAPMAAMAQGGVVSSPPKKNGEQAQEYWTPERMRDAKPIPMPGPDSRTGRDVSGRKTGRSGDSDRSGTPPDETEGKPKGRR